MRKYIKGFIPPSLLNLVKITKEKVKLSKIDRIDVDTTSLASISHFNFSLEEVFSSKKYAKEWAEVNREISPLSIPDRTGGVNTGDRRALYYLIRHIRPKSVLEIGTHIGASTVHISIALKKLNSLDKESLYRLTTVDINDVNDGLSKPWKRFDSAYSPMEMINKLSCDSIVTFITDSSINYCKKSEQKYDFIFLDGSHSAPIIYQEIPTALKILNKGGLILLHDYFFKFKPLWSDKALIPGPYFATRRLQSEGANIKVLPLDRLPWPTKLNSNVTSLAMLGKY